MTKVVHIITDLSTGGAQMMLYKLLVGMDRSRFDNIVICLTDKGTVGHRIESLGVPVYAAGMLQGRFSMFSLWRLLRIIRSLQPDIIQGWMYHGNIVATISRFFLFKKVYVLWNIRHSLYDLNHEKKQTVKIIRIGAICSKMATNIIYNSKISSVQHEILGYSAKRMTIIPNGFDCTVFKPSSIARHKLCKELNIDIDDIVVGLICRFHPMKDHASFFKAAGILAGKYPDISFVLAGPGVDVDNPEINTLLKKNGILELVHLLGERKDTPELNAALDIACSSSAYGEAFPNIIGEAMACGVPCVATDVGDSAWIIGETGKIVPPRNAAALAAAVADLIQLGVAERKVLGSNARKRILENFRLQEITEKYEELYGSY